MTYFAATAAALAFASPAVAQGAAAPAGFRVEGLVGYDRPGTDGFHESGVLFGIGAGYDIALGHSVSLGIDAEATDSTADKDGVSAGRDLYAGGRANFAISRKA